MSSVDCGDRDISILLDDLKLHINADILQNHLRKCSHQKLQSWKDTNKFDLLHHAILEDNFVAVGTLFALGFFKPPHEVLTSWSYVHLAAVLGERTIVSMLLQERPYDNMKVVLDWEVFNSVIAPKLDVSKVTVSIVPTEEKEKKFAFLPLDLAARYGHERCVKTILDFHIFRFQQSQGASRKSSVVKMGHLDMACILDCPFAVRLLLTTNPEKEDTKNALDIALKMAKPECVDALLRFGVDTKQLFGGMNLFHVLFAYSKSFEESWFESFVVVTSILVRHQYDVNACRPSRTYPLYTLLRCTTTKMSNSEKSIPCVMAALLVLLQAGADPNFDEVLVEEAVTDREYDTAFGRKPYPSALHCLIDAGVSLMEEVSDFGFVAKYMYKCSELLLRHGADPSYMGHYSDSQADNTVRHGNALHALCGAMPHLGHVDSSLLLLLLRHGGNPDACINGQYPLTSYISAISPELEEKPSTTVCCTSLKGGISARQTSPEHRRRAQAGSTTSHEDRFTEEDMTQKNSDLCIDVTRVCRMVGFMSHRSQQDCVDILQSRLMSHPSSAAGATFALRMVLRELEKYTQQVPSLRGCCARVVWRCCRRHVGNVYKLPVPMPLMNAIMDHL